MGSTRSLDIQKLSKLIREIYKEKKIK